jgi:pimeloyl-ACP methyl ester carboxylesterase
MHCSVRGKGEAVLFIHGMPTNGRLWDGVVLDLARHFQCFVVDLPGMGGTPFLPYTSAYFAQVAAQLEDVRIRHRVQRWHIVGHDGGCAIAAQYARLFPKRAGCLALLSPAIFPDLRPFFLLELLRKPVLGELSAPLVHALFWHVAMRRALSDTRNAPQRASFFQNFASIAGPWKLMRLVRWGSPQVVLQDFPSILRKLPCPTLVIHGSRDVLPESFACRAADLISDAQLISLDSGHFIPLEQARQVAQNLLAYFTSHGAKLVVGGTPHAGAESRNRPLQAKRTRRRPELVPLPAGR